MGRWHPSAGASGTLKRSVILVIIGATPEGTKELVGFTDGSRESAADWRVLLLDLRRHGLTIAPKLAVVDGALGFWKKLGEVWPKTRFAWRASAHSLLVPKADHSFVTSVCEV